ncbi:MAG: hypothetical protein F6J97_02235 [Leptolyngbya sp. SIO4C1]|nr:hypothetical protein [Leptolyngbya sp. SIO4C1]
MSGLSIILAVVLLVAVFCWLTGYRLPMRRRRSPELRSGGSVTRATRQQLMRLVNGNRAVADRLVERVRSQNPDRSEQWCWEKAIYDIERDRRA